jgi:hypothetical protein
MAARREVLERVGPLDEKLFNYYDDTELGIRAWKCGYEVAVAPDAWIDHGFGHSDKIFRNKIFLCERNRIRTVLKYFPLRRLPAWFVRELMFSGKQERLFLTNILRAWRWNVMHLPSAFKLRIKFSLRRGPFDHLLEPSWGHYPPSAPNNQIIQPDPARAGTWLEIDGDSEAHQLNFGWYYAEKDDTRYFRWTASVASAIFRLRSPVLGCTVAFAGSEDREARLVIRPLGSLEPCFSEVFTMPGKEWTWRTFLMHLPAGHYELLLECEDLLTDKSGRRLGVAISSIRFE